MGFARRARAWLGTPGNGWIRRLLATLEAEDPHVRRKAAKELGKTGHKSVIKPLTVTAKADPDATAREACR
ncbi:MAG: HEAT repeat domain-containing protein [Planctomycetota bacterium]